MRGVAGCFRVKAPSNIALIKYMGKKDSASNLPENGSISMTLEELCTYAEIQVDLRDEDGAGAWVDEAPADAPRGVRAPGLGAAGIEKILSHLGRVRGASPDLLATFGLEPSPFASGRGGFTLRSANTFPQASGIASSASSFAAVTLAMAWACAASPSDFREVYMENVEFRRALAGISRRGSGSSCRSFEGPWVGWDGDRTLALEANLPELRHLVLVVSERAKRVSSSQAHLRIKSSPLWKGRVERAETRKATLTEALRAGDLRAVARLAWSETWEMHGLFHTAEPPFTYWEPATVELLQWFSGIMEDDVEGGDLPIVTLDAGPNPHLICPASRVEGWKARIGEKFGGIRILEDRPGAGARLISATSKDRE